MNKFTARIIIELKYNNQNVTINNQQISLFTESKFHIKITKLQDTTHVQTLYIYIMCSNFGKMHHSQVF